jgi:hypothetical protein
MLLVPLFHDPARAQEVVVGVDLVNQPDRLTPQQQDTIVDNMKDAGVRVIRAGIANNGKTLDFAKRVYPWHKNRMVCLGHTESIWEDDSFFRRSG